MVVSVAFLYNLWVIVYRFSFHEIHKETASVSARSKAQQKMH